MKNVASNVQINITLKDALYQWIKDDVQTATIVMNSENVYVSSKNYK